MNRQYDNKFKINAVRYYRESGKSLKDAANDLNIPRTNLLRWNDEIKCKYSEQFKQKILDMFFVNRIPICVICNSFNLHQGTAQYWITKQEQKTIEEQKTINQQSNKIYVQTYLKFDQQQHPEKQQHPQQQKNPRASTDKQQSMCCGSKKELIPQIRNLITKEHFNDYSKIMIELSEDGVKITTIKHANLIAIFKKYGE